MLVRDIVKERGKDYKIIIYENPENEEDIKVAYITLKDVKFNFISKLNIKIDDIGSLLFYGSEKIFALIHINDDIYSLKPLKSDQDLDTIFYKMKEMELSEGEFGKVSILPQNIVVKISKQKKLNRDIIMEIGIYSMLKHLHCLPIMYGFDLKKQKMIYIERGIYTLTRLIPDLTINRKMDVIFRLCNCMRSIAGQGIMHLDLKPANIIVGNDDQIYIIDWGMAEIDTRRKHFRYKEPYEMLKQTLWYRSPEILARNFKYSIPVDIYSLGLIFLEMFTGQIVMDADSEEEYMIKVLQMSGFDQFTFKYGDKPEIIIPFKDDKKIRDVHYSFEKIFNSVNYSTKAKTMLRIKEKFNIQDEALQDFLAGMLEFKPEFRSKWNDMVIHPVFQRMEKESISRFNMLINNMPIIEDINKVWDNHKNINSIMRKLLFRELNMAGNKYPIESLELTFQLVDLWIYLDSDNIVSINKLPLLGLSMLILGISIYQDVLVSELIDKLSRQSKIYSKKEFKSQLNIILTVFNGNIIIPTYTSYSYFLEKQPINSLDNYIRSDIYAKPFLTQIVGEEVKLDIWKR